MALLKILQFAMRTTEARNGKCRYKPCRHHITNISNRKNHSARLKSRNRRRKRIRYRNLSQECIRPNTTQDTGHLLRLGKMAHGTKTHEQSNNDLNGYPGNITRRYQHLAQKRMAHGSKTRSKDPTQRPTKIRTWRIKRRTIAPAPHEEHPNRCNMQWFTTSLISL